MQSLAQEHSDYRFEIDIDALGGDYRTVVDAASERTVYSRLELPDLGNTRGRSTDLAEGIISDNGSLLGLSPSDDIELYKERIVGSIHYSFFRNRISDIPVVGADLVVKTTRPLDVDKRLFEDRWGSQVPDDHTLFQSGDIIDPDEVRDDWTVLCITNHLWMARNPEFASPALSESQARSRMEIYAEESRSILNAEMV